MIKFLKVMNSVCRIRKEYLYEILKQSLFYKIALLLSIIVCQAKYNNQTHQFK